MQDFEVASRHALQFLQKKFGHDLWMVTRVDNNDWIILSAEDRGYGVREGSVLKWSDSFCSRMVRGEGPNVAPDSARIQAYAEAPIGRQMDIKSYIGFPIQRPDGTLFGTICAIDPQAQPSALADNIDIMTMVADLLARLLNSELEVASAKRQLERMVDKARRDALTSLYNRQGWMEFLELEEARCRRFGNPACIIAIDLDDLKKVNDKSGHVAGDSLLVGAAQALRSAVRNVDIIARTGGDEFMVLCIECDEEQGALVRARIEAAFHDRGISASIGHAMRRPENGLYLTSHLADQNMYEVKKQRKDEAAISLPLAS